MSTTSDGRLIKAITLIACCMARLFVENRKGNRNLPRTMFAPLGKNMTRAQFRNATWRHGTE